MTKSILYFMCLLKIIAGYPMKHCIHCKFCKLHIENNPSYDIKPVKFGLCTYFPTKIDEQYHQNTGELLENNSNYELCSKARTLDNLCGKSGKYFVQRQQKNTL